MSYQKCPICKGKGTIKKEQCTTCSGEKIICKKTGLPPSKYVYPYTIFPIYPTYPTYPVYPTYPSYPIEPYYHAPILTGEGSTFCTASNNPSTVTYQNGLYTPTITNTITQIN